MPDSADLIAHPGSDGDRARAAMERLLALASEVTGAPMASVSVLSEERLIFAARHGFDLPEMPSREGICTTCVLSKSPLIVEDALADPRFKDLPLVRSLPIRFYAGVPVVERTGRIRAAFCVFGAEPRKIPAEHIRMLGELASVAAELMHLAVVSERLSTATEELANKHERLTLLSHVAAHTDNAVIITDAEGRIRWVNDGFMRITEYTLDEVAGRTPGSVLHGPGTDQSTVAFMRSRLARAQ